MSCKQFAPNCHPLFVGSLPAMDAGRAFDLVRAYSPAILNWSQMPGNDKREGMVAQFAPGIPGFRTIQSHMHLDTGHTEFEAAMLRLYEAYLNSTDGAGGVDDDLAALPARRAPGFYTFMAGLEKLSHTPLAVKGQITGPFTMGTVIKDTGGRAVFYDDVLRDLVVKSLVLKARWQVGQLDRCSVPVLLSIDEPALAGFGTSQFISISRDDVVAALSEIVGAIQADGAMAGVHVCANTDWSMLMTTGVDLISFDAYNYFDRVVLYQNELIQFIHAGKWLAWGIIPSLDPMQVESESTAGIIRQFDRKLARIVSLGIDRTAVLKQSLITPSCGLGTLSIDHALKVMRMTKEVSDTIRKEEFYA